MNWFSLVGILCASPSQERSIFGYLVTVSTTGIFSLSPDSVSESTILPNLVTIACSPSVTT